MSGGGGKSGGERKVSVNLWLKGNQCDPIRLARN